MTHAALDVELAGTRVTLRADRTLWWADERMLVVADAHVGKAVSFRRLGVPVPRGTTGDALTRLSAAIGATGARSVVFLGDLLHSARALAPGTMDAARRWRSEHATLRIVLVRGNHDRHAGDPPPDWDFEVVDGPLACGAFMLRHEPEPCAAGYVLAGHVHPCAVVGARGHDRLRLPSFHFGAQVGLLPAFGDFTGMHAVPQAPGDRVFVIADDAVRPWRSPLHSRP